MNTDQASAKWDEIKGKAKRIWGELTEDDFKKAEGSVDKLYAMIEKKFGDAKEVILTKLQKLHLPERH